MYRDIGNGVLRWQVLVIRQAQVSAQGLIISHTSLSRVSDDRALPSELQARICAVQMR